jgi:hypothetical protein
MLWHWKPPKLHTFQCRTIVNDNMADIRTCEVGVTLVPLNTES